MFIIVDPELAEVMAGRAPVLARGNGAGLLAALLAAQAAVLLLLGALAP